MAINLVQKVIRGPAPEEETWHHQVAENGALLAEAYM
jgi:hypothetical protein